MHPTIAQLISNGPLLTDGAWGTQLQARGLAIGEFPDAWNIRCPDKVAEVARAYVDAGSDIILTNTFGSNRIRLEEADYGSRVTELNRAGVRISREAASWMGSCMGCAGIRSRRADVAPWIRRR